MNLYHYASPPNFYKLAGTLVPWAAWSAAILGVCGLYIGFFVAPTDFQQGEAYRIIFIHVPSAWMGMLIYLVMAFWGAIGLAFNARLPFMLMRALAPTGAVLTAVALWTGAVWGKPMWGYLVGVGRASHVDTDLALPVHGYAGLVVCNRRHQAQ